MASKFGEDMRNKAIINNLYALVAISTGQKLKQLYDEIYKDQSKTPEEVRDILEKLHILDMFCEEIDKHYAGSGTYLSILLDAAGGHASLYFRQYSEYLKEIHQKTSTSKKTKKFNQKHYASQSSTFKKRSPHLKTVISQNKLTHIHPQHEYSIFNKYQHAQKGSVEYVKNDFINHYNPSKYHTLDEALLERARTLGISPAKYKEDLIHGTHSKMEIFVNHIEPGWSTKPSPTSEDEKITKNEILKNFSHDKEVEKHINEYSLFNKYQHATKGSVEYVKNDFMNYYDPSKNQTLDEVLLERSHALHMSPAKYKEDLIHGSSSKMEVLVNLIEPGWSTKPPPASDEDNTTLKSK